MTVNPVDMQVILPQTGQVNKISRGLQFQQQTEQQILGQQVQIELRQQEQQVNKTAHVEHNRVDNEKRKQKQGEQHFMSQDRQDNQESEETAELAVAAKSNLGNVLDIKI